MIFKYVVYLVFLYQMSINIKNIYTNKKISIEDCFNYFQRYEEEYNHCTNCNKNTKFNNNQKLYLPIGVLLISLYYEKEHNDNLDLKFDISEKIQLDNFIIKKLNNNNINYELFGKLLLFLMIIQMKKIKNLQFIVKIMQYNKINCYNNGKVNSVNDFADGIKNKCKPYYLFYVKENDKKNIFEIKNN